MLTYAIVGHLVGDYLLQNDWMALGKKRSTPICAIHCLLWTAAVMIASGWWAWWVPLALFLPHFAQDRTNVVKWWMGRIGQGAFLQPPMSPWSIIVVDNVWHIVALAVIGKCI